MPNAKRGSGWRAALAASAAVHAAAVALFALVGQLAAGRTRPADPGIDTRVADGPRIELHFSEVTFDSPPTPEPAARRPEAFQMPPALPADLLARLRTPPPPAVVEVTFTPTPLQPVNAAVPDPN